MATRPRLSHRRHTGKVLPHHHTSYSGIAFVLMLMTVLLSGLSFATSADTHPPPQSGSVGVTGQMPEPPPKTAAVIQKPTGGQHFSTSPTTVSGTCPKNTVVEIYKNDIFAGATACKDNGTFSIDIDLLYGSNTLVAKVYDTLDQVGPDSNAVTVFYDALPPTSDPLDITSFTATQLLLRSSPVYRGVFPQQPLTVDLEILGGVPPFAVSVEWGDTKHDLLSRPNNVPFNARHVYSKPGSYQITIQATDKDGRVAFLSIVAIVNGKAEILSASTASSDTSLKPSLMWAWPLLAVAIAMAISFWLGERREKHVLEAASL